ncbi:MAG: hypothetical protein M0Z60_01750 [Nitrospiraceae bacterium]|nr:hypothetical protein [Nitrospiraceae bacterium]
MKKLNCWEYNRCGREQGGARTEEFGTCPASTEKKLHGIHGGENAGRACWVVEGTLCDGKKQGSFSKKYDTCMSCDFCRKVRDEEQSGWHPSATLFMMISFGGRTGREC